LRVEGREKGGHGTRRETACTAEVGKAGRARFEGAGTGKRADTELGRRGLGGHVCGWTGGTKGLEGVGLEGTCAGGKAGKRGDTGLRAVALKGTIEGA